MRIAPALAVALLAFAATLGACARQEPDSPQALTQRFYEFYLVHGLRSGLPSVEQSRSLSSMLSTNLQNALARARRQQDKFIAEHPDRKPPWIEGDLFTSLFEGATEYRVINVDEQPGEARVLVGLKYRDDKGQEQDWADRLVLVRDASGWRIDDVEYGGHWDFANRGSLRHRLAPDEAQPSVTPR